jgi:parvulin-like peptidyl-prolyl isomerase
MKLIFLLLLIFSLNHNIISQDNNEVIAQIGDKTITVEELKYRYEFTPQINRKYFDQGKAKEELLYTLIAENLFAAEAEKMGFDTLQSMNMNYIPLEKMHVRDALYKEFIKDKVKLDTVKFVEGLKLASYKLFVDYIYSEEKNDINSAYNIISGEGDFDSLVTLIENAEYVPQPYEVKYGQMYYKAEEAIYQLEMKQFTKPIESPDGWYIFRLIGMVPATFQSNDQKISFVKDVVERRVEDSIYNEFWNNFFVDQKVTTDGSLFWYFTEKLHEVINGIKISRNIEEGEKITIGNEDFVGFKKSLNPDSLSKVFIKFNPDPITLESFVNEFVFEGFYTFTTDLNMLASQVNSRVKRQIELEMLTRKGYSLGMENLPEVKSSTEIWRENYLSTLYLKHIVKNTEITENDIREYLKDDKNANISEIKVNIIEILTDSLEVIQEALELSDDDIKLKEYAKKHTKREWTRETGGEFGLFPVSEYGEIGKIAASMELGDVFGPLSTNEGYSLFKLIEKQSDTLNVDEVNITNEIKTQIRYEKIKEKLDNLAADLADAYNVTINNSILNSLDLLNSQMVVFRYMGFGGRILAFPYSSPFYEWKEKWEQKKRELL